MASDAPESAAFGGGFEVRIPRDMADSYTCEFDATPRAVERAQLGSLLSEQHTSTAGDHPGVQEISRPLLRPLEDVGVGLP